jgi:hypothetical protein
VNFISGSLRTEIKWSAIYSQQMILTLDNLNAGLHVWATGKYPSDMHNAEYHDMYSARSNGITQQWWDATVKRLAQWRAIRPMSKVVIATKGSQCLSAVGAEYAKLKSNPSEEPSIVNTDWTDVAPVFGIASQIKQPWPPVFASKMCHFLFPKLFIVMDTQLCDPFEYELYWRGMKDEWQRFSNKAQAMSMFTAALKPSKPIQGDYPWETKIMELSHIGWKSSR